MPSSVLLNGRFGLTQVASDSVKALERHIDHNKTFLNVHEVCMGMCRYRSKLPVICDRYCAA